MLICGSVSINKSFQPLNFRIPLSYLCKQYVIRNGHLLNLRIPLRNLCRIISYIGRDFVGFLQALCGGQSGAQALDFGVPFGASEADETSKLFYTCNDVRISV